ncbi:unnamed protein product [Ectocarpus sp. 8 AP-2014]
MLNFFRVIPWPGHASWLTAAACGLAWHAHTLVPKNDTRAYTQNNKVMSRKAREPFSSQQQQQRQHTLRMPTKSSLNTKFPLHPSQRPTDTGLTYHRPTNKKTKKKQKQRRPLLFLHPSYTHFAPRREAGKNSAMSWRTRRRHEHKTDAIGRRNKNKK